MNDEEIVNLYWQRNSKAIEATAKQYDAYCRKIAQNLLGNAEDVEECLNDMYLHAWNAIPPNCPKMLSTYLGKIVRNLSIDRYKSKQTKKRGEHPMELVLDELAECVSGSDSPEQEFHRKELVQVINQFIATLSPKKCSIFLGRYWYAFPISTIARQLGMSEQNVSVTLYRIRTQLKKYLNERGYDL